MSRCCTPLGDPRRIPSRPTRERRRSALATSQRTLVAPHHPFMMSRSVGSTSQVATHESAPTTPKASRATARGRRETFFEPLPDQRHDDHQRAVRGIRERHRLHYRSRAGRRIVRFLSADCSRSSGSPATRGVGASMVDDRSGRIMAVSARAGFQLAGAIGSSCRSGVLERCRGILPLARRNAAL